MELEKINNELKSKNALEIITWSYEKFGDSLVMTSSFGEYSSVMLDLVKQIIPDIPIIFIDTGYLTLETYIFAERLREEMNLNIHIYSSERTTAMQEAIYGQRWEDEESEDFAKFKKELKVEPLERALKDFYARAILSGVRKEETEERKKFDTVMDDGKRYKIHPILNWSEEDVKNYIQENNLLINENYFDICKGEKQKKECGIHVFSDGGGI